MLPADGVAGSMVVAAVLRVAHGDGGTSYSFLRVGDLDNLCFGLCILVGCSAVRIMEVADDMLICFLFMEGRRRIVTDLVVVFLLVGNRDGK